MLSTSEMSDSSDTRVHHVTEERLAKKERRLYRRLATQNPDCPWFLGWCSPIEDDVSTDVEIDKLLPVRSYDKFHGKTGRVGIHYMHSGTNPRLIHNSWDPKNRDCIRHIYPVRALYVTEVDALTGYQYVNNLFARHSQMIRSHRQINAHGVLGKQYLWDTVIDCLTTHSTKSIEYYVNGIRHIDYFMPIIGELPLPKQYSVTKLTVGRSRRDVALSESHTVWHDPESIVYYDKPKTDPEYIAIYTVIFPKPLKDTITPPTDSRKEKSRRAKRHSARHRQMIGRDFQYDIRDLDFGKPSDLHL